MKVGTFVRTFEDFEESHIEKFVESHAPFSDVICVGLVGTSQKTVKSIMHHPKVVFREFYSNWESAYYQFLSDWSAEIGVDWAIFDDADHYPNLALQRDARALLEANHTPFAYSLLMYMWGDYNSNVYFPDLNRCTPSERLWAWRPQEWRPDINLAADKTVEIRNQPDALLTPEMIIPHPPYCVRHYSFLTEESVRRKMAFNAARGVPQAYPLDSCGQLDVIPEWALP